MYICLCNGVTENQIRDAVAEGAATVHDLRAKLGVASCCGCCAECAQQVIDQTSTTVFEPAFQPA